MDWNEFNKQLQNRVDDPGTRYMLGLMYERMLDMTKQLDMSSSIIMSLVENMNGVIGLSEILDGRMKGLHDLIKGQSDGVSLESVPLTNDDIN